MFEYFSNYLYKLIFNRLFKKKTVVKNYNIKRKIKNIGIIIGHNYDFDDFFIDNIALKFNVLKKNIFILDFNKKKYQFVNNYQYKKDDISFFGSLSGASKIFSNQDFDLLINYFNSNRFLMNIISLKCNKKISAGFINSDKRINDIVFSFSPDNKDVFLNEIIKFTKN
ncbi:MAG: hypothetical protein P8M03_02480 [Flavobacteriaceae bacterium]|nr:hypothetical protein [Flavobacteriaceae bacterium]